MEGDVVACTNFKVAEEQLLFVTSDKEQDSVAKDLYGAELSLLQRRNGAVLV